MRFLRPDLVHWLLIVPVIIAGAALHDAYVGRVRRGAPIAKRFAHLSRRSSRTRSAAALVAAIAAAGGLVFALMRPQAVLAGSVPEYERQDLIVMLDRSVSMRAHDIQPSRFSRAIQELRNFVQHKPDAIDRVALVGFADSSVILSYLTTDTDSIDFYLDWIENDPTTLLGTNIGAALKSARDVSTKDDRPTKKLFLLLSDGEDYGAELQQSLAVFTAEQLSVHCIGIGSDESVFIPIPQPGGQEIFLRDEDGALVKTHFEEATLRHVAAATGGRYARSPTGSELAKAIADVVKGERKLLRWRATTEYRDLYPAGLGVAAAAGGGLGVLV